MVTLRSPLLLAALLALALPLCVQASSAADPGVTSTSILIGGTVPLSGEAASGGLTAKGAAGYFAYVNAHGGVFKRKINYKYVDDEYDPSKTIQATRQLVQQDHVFAIFNPLGTAQNIAIRPYLNSLGVPQVFVASGWGGWARQFVSQQSYDPTATDVQSQIARLKASGANTLMIFAFGKFAIQSFVFVKKLGWKPQIFVNAVAAATSVMLLAKTSGQTEGTISIVFFKDPSDPKWAKDPGMKLYKMIMSKYVHADYKNGYYGAGMASAFAMVAALKKAGKNLTRKGLLRAVTHLDIRNNPFALPGIRIKTSPTDRYPLEQAQL